MESMKRLAVCAIALTMIIGCLSHVAPDSQPDHLQLAWAPDFGAAVKRAADEKRPILLCMIAGDVEKRC